jgi:hypothetical protein
VFLLSALVLHTICSCGNEGVSDPSNVVADFGRTPKIDGVIEEGEWDDANRVELDSTKTIFLKHDETNLYFAFNAADGGNLYFLKNNKIEILHSSFSLGWAEYLRSNNNSWVCDKEYEWALNGIQKKPEDEIQGEMNKYLLENGWVGSLMPMGNSGQTEFAISFRWLEITHDISTKELVKIPKVFISSFYNLPPSQRKGRNLRFRWPSYAAPIDSLNSGYTPKTISLDASNWGDMFIKHQD